MNEYYTRPQKLMKNHSTMRPTMLPTLPTASPTTLSIGPYVLSSSALLAPMAGVTDSPFRQQCQFFGAGLTTSEMLTSNTSLWHSRKSSFRLQPTTQNSGQSKLPHSVQIVGSEADQLAQAAVQCAQQGADIIDINMGCPAKKVCKKAAGSALLKDELLVKSMLNAVVSAVNIPVTLKIRTGWDSNTRNAVSIAHIAENEGIAALAIHGRTRQCRFNGSAEYDTIASVKQAISIPVIANGDIIDAETARLVSEYTQADAIMIGRAAQGQPWIFTQIIDALAGKPITKLSFTKKQAHILHHIKHIHAFYGELLGLRLCRKHVSWYLEHLQFSQEYRKMFNQLSTTTLQQAFIANLQEQQTLEGKAA